MERTLKNAGLLLLLTIVFISVIGWYLAISITVELDSGKSIKVPFGKTVGWTLNKAGIEPFSISHLQIGEEGFVLTSSRSEIFFNGKKVSLTYRIYSPGKLTVISRKVKFIEPATFYRTEERPAIVTGSGPFLQPVRSGMPAVFVRNSSDRLHFISEQTAFRGLAPVFRRTDGVKEKIIALTFDDGPSIYTPAILKILDKYNVKATFFVIGKHIEKHPEYLREIALKGHLIGNHTYSHLNLKNRPISQLSSEINKTALLISRLTGKECYWFRPPMGLYDYNLISFVKNQNYQVSFWTIDSLDWKIQNPQVICERVLKDLKPGDVILLHDGGGPREGTVQATEMIIRAALKKGFTFVTLADFSRIKSQSGVSL